MSLPFTPSSTVFTGPYFLRLLGTVPPFSPGFSFPGNPTLLFSFGGIPETWPQRCGDHCSAVMVISCGALILTYSTPMVAGRFSSPVSHSPALREGPRSWRKPCPVPSSRDPTPQLPSDPVFAPAQTSVYDGCPLPLLAPSLGWLRGRTFTPALSAC